MRCDQCGKKIEKPKDSVGTGYATTTDGETICYACCALRDAEYMRQNGRITLYLTANGITNWPGTLRFSVARRSGSRHNMVPSGRTDVWFHGPDDAIWHGVHIGYSEILHCKRTKRTALP